MLNNKPTFAKNKDGKQKYQQGLFVPINKDKVVQLNKEGGLWYRSSYEKKFYNFLDLATHVVKWNAEIATINYSFQSMKDGRMVTTEHRYYPDIYYEIKFEDGSIKKFLGEIKPGSETGKPKPLGEKYSHKQLVNYEYAQKMWAKNVAKWIAADEYCQRRGMEFKIITETILNNLTRFV